MHLSDNKAAAWLGQMADSLASGIVPAEAVGLVGGLPQDLNETLIKHFEKGRSWQDAVDTLLGFLSQTERALLVAAEASGTLSQGLERLAQRRRERVAFKRKLFFSMLYPAFIVHFAILIVPIQRITDGDILGYFTVALSIYLPLWALFLAGVAMFRAFPKAGRTAMRIIPLLGKYSMKRDMSDLSQTLAGCGLAGVKLEYSWALAIDAIGSKRFTLFGESVLAQIGQGRPASTAFSSFPWLPSNFVQQYKVGERTGQLVPNLEAVAATFAKDAKTALTMATVFYAAMALMLAFGLAAFQIFSFYSGYFNQINEIAS